jgi:hypothetical protein
MGVEAMHDELWHVSKMLQTSIRVYGICSTAEGALILSDSRPPAMIRLHARCNLRYLDPSAIL